MMQFLEPQQQPLTDLSQHLFNGFSKEWGKRELNPGLLEFCVW